MATNTYVAIETQTLTGTSASVVLGSGNTIPQTYTDLVLVVNAKASATGAGLRIRINGVTSASYGSTLVWADGSSAGSGGYTSNNAFDGHNYQQGLPTNGFQLTSHFMDYTNNTTYKTSLTRYNAYTYETNFSVNSWRGSTGTAKQPITQIEVLSVNGTFAVGSTFTLYGIANASIGDTPKATGGIITQDSSYTYHVFGASGTFTPKQNLTNVDYLVIAGGGGGTTGGGGAGGLRSTVTPTGGGGTAESKISLTSGTAYTITVGAGGSGGNPVGATQDATQGIASSIAGSGLTTISSVGGGRGTGYAGSGNNGNVGGDGGSGGGALCVGNVGDSFAGGNRTTNQGFAGGASTVGGSGTGTYWGGGGGGGAGAVGQAGVSWKGSTGSAVGGNGGNGVAIPSFAATTGTGIATYYAGGGAGGCETNATNGIGGLGGGGTGRHNEQSQTVGILNTGGGGGGTGPGQGNGAAGGSGIVIIRYAN
jgi:hypothetical protein